MLFDVSDVRAPLPDGILVFASGANQLSEIRGFARLGIPVGVSASHLNEAAIAALIEFRQPVMVDSGAFSEVAFSAEGPRIVSRITEEEWQRRLAVYVRLALSLRNMAMLVAPDQIGNQQETLRRLRRFRSELACITTTGARLLLPLQVGALSHREFYMAGQSAAGVPLIPAMPMRKSATRAADLLAFVQELKPDHIHLLGMGIENRRTAKLVRAIQHYGDGIRISMDFNRLRAVTGGARPLTRLEAELRSAATERLYGAVDSPVLTLIGDLLDYTELIASPSMWCPQHQLRTLADAVSLNSADAGTFFLDPDSFLQSPFRDEESPSWIEHPRMALELDRAWEQYVDRTIRSAVRTAAIVSVFADSRLSGQVGLNPSHNWPREEGAR